MNIPRFSILAFEAGNLVPCLIQNTDEIDIMTQFPNFE